MSLLNTLPLNRNTTLKTTDTLKAVAPNPDEVVLWILHGLSYIHRDTDTIRPASPEI